MTPGGSTRRWLRSLTRAASWHRRKLAVVAAVAAVLTTVSALAPAPSPTVRVLRSTTRIAAGAVVTAADVTLRPTDPGAVPEGALTDPATILGKAVLAAVPAGQVLTDLDVVSPRAGAAPGHVLAPLRLSDAEVVALLGPGDKVDVLAAAPEAGAARVVARAVRVAAVPAPAEDAGDREASGSLLLVDVDPRVATVLAQAAVSAQLSVTLR